MHKSRNREAIGLSSQSGSGEASRVLDLLRADGHVCSRRRDNCVHLGTGTDDICISISNSGKY